MNNITIYRHDDESLESLIRRWNRDFERAEVMKSIRQHEAYESKSQKRKRKHEAELRRRKRVAYDLKRNML